MFTSLHTYKTVCLIHNLAATFSFYVRSGFYLMRTQNVPLYLCFGIEHCTRWNTKKNLGHVSDGTFDHEWWNTVGILCLQAMRITQYVPCQCHCFNLLLVCIETLRMVSNTKDVTIIIVIIIIIRNKENMITWPLEIPMNIYSDFLVGNTQTAYSIEKPWYESELMISLWIRKHCSNLQFHFHIQAQGRQNLIASTQTLKQQKKSQRTPPALTFILRSLVIYDLCVRKGGVEGGNCQIVCSWCASVFTCVFVWACVWSVLIKILSKTNER